MRYRYKKRTSKYGNQKVSISDKKFDSKKECNRYQLLQKMQQLGEISELETQKAFVLVPSVKFEHEPRAKPALKYIADFVYLDKDGKLVVEDVKSAITKKDPVYRIKKHLMMAVHNIEIIEV